MRLKEDDATCSVYPMADELQFFVCTMLGSGGGVFKDIFYTGAKNGRFHNEAVVQLNVNQ